MDDCKDICSKTTEIYQNLTGAIDEKNCVTASSPCSDGKNSELPFAQSNDNTVEASTAGHAIRNNLMPNKCITSPSSVNFIDVPDFSCIDHSQCSDSEIVHNETEKESNQYKKSLS